MTDFLSDHPCLSRIESDLFSVSLTSQYSKYEKTQNDDYLKEAANQQLGGYGFASFCYILACILMIVAAAYISPIMCGSPNEQKMVKSPSEIEGGYAAFDKDTDGNKAV